jgi:hypothetical protein
MTLQIGKKLTIQIILLTLPLAMVFLLQQGLTELAIQQMVLFGMQQTQADL